MAEENKQETDKPQAQNGNVAAAQAQANAGHKAEADQENVLEHYMLNAHGMVIDVTIKSSAAEFVPIYYVSFQGVSEATRLLLMSFRRELITMVPIDPTKVEVESYVEELNKRYVQASNILIDRYLPSTDAETKSVLTAYILNMMLGLGDLEVPLSDENLEEIAVNGSRSPIWVFHKRIGWCKTNIKPQNEDAIYDQAEQIGRRVGRELNNLAPLMDAELVDGSRVNATLYPISQVGNTITIRKFAKNPWTMPALVKAGSLTPEIAGLLWLCIQNEISILISGGTASGKTSFLNAASIFFPPTRRIISVEETRELALPDTMQWVSMISRQPNPEGKGEVTLYDLMVNALRQRPDIMLVGEVRTGKDAETLFEAIHTGHSVYATVHADNAQDTIVRMTNPPIATPKIQMNALGAIVSLFRHRSKGIRRTLEFAEMLRTGDANVLYRWNMRDDTFAQISDMTNLAETMSLYGGLTKSEIAEDIKTKAKIIRWMIKYNVTDINNAGFLVSNYYRNKDRVIDVVNNDVAYSKELF
ncbi:Flp pilus assembly complex ATPase component TadA [Candidatus Marsarchaeota archaeon]|nr:Flp pilus assembly complex ATPase component TadA [Candidatus Marsarchaeota archaeon]MCL5404429.1 Flp pilus assembly complex ATPase component TadA [Candidatus Marsarchaeota archaeon]